MITSEHVRASEIPKEPSYPYIGKSRATGLIVLFDSPKSGVAITADAYNPIGYYYKKWTEDGFTPLPEGEQVILTQGGAK